MIEKFYETINKFKKNLFFKSSGYYKSFYWLNLCLCCLYKYTGYYISFYESIHNDNKAKLYCF